MLSGQSLDYLALNQFRKMILCVKPDSWPILDYADYGCYCGYGGSGTPVDDLDRSVLQCGDSWSCSCAACLKGVL